MNNLTFGYVRVSSADQNEERQLHELKNAGVEERNIYIDKKSGKDFNREQYKAMIDRLREHDLLIITSLDSLGRNYLEIQSQWSYITQTIKANVFADGELMLHIRQSGGVSYPVNAAPDEKRNELHNIICKTADKVREFVNAMEYAPKLAADGLTEDYKKLLEYNGVVLCALPAKMDTKKLQKTK